jgi:hypothetical protein
MSPPIITIPIVLGTIFGILSIIEFINFAKDESDALKGHDIIGACGFGILSILCWVALIMMI